MTINKVLKMIDLIGSQKGYDAFKEQTTKMLDKSINSDKYWLEFKMIADQWAANPKLTDKSSILPTLFTAAKLNLNPSPQLHHIWFIPYKGVLTYQVGYQGMITLADRAGYAVRAGLVYEKDEWDFYETELGQKFLHRPNFLARDKGKELFAWSIFQNRTTNSMQVHTMESSHIDNIKKMVLARMRDSGSPWKDPLFEPEMRKKSCIRRHSKYEPASPDIAKVVEREEQNELGNVKTDYHEELDGIIEQSAYPDPKSEEGKALDAELNQIAMQQENGGVK